MARMFAFLARMKAALDAATADHTVALNLAADLDFATTADLF